MLGSTWVWVVPGMWFIRRHHFCSDTKGWWSMGESQDWPRTSGGSDISLLGTCSCSWLFGWWNFSTHSEACLCWMWQHHQGVEIHWWELEARLLPPSFQTYGLGQGCSLGTQSWPPEIHYSQCITRWNCGYLDSGMNLLYIQHMVLMNFELCFSPAVLRKKTP